MARRFPLGNILDGATRDLVVMSQAHYNRLVARLELYHRLEEAEHQVRRGRKTRGHQEVMRKLRAQLG